MRTSGSAMGCFDRAAKVANRPPRRRAVALLAVLLGASLGVSSSFSFKADPNQLELKPQPQPEAGAELQNEARDLAAFVFNGKDARADRYPYLASLRHPQSGNHFCGGALIAPSIVLTAAHCVDGAANGFRTPEVHFGRTCTNCKNEPGIRVARSKEQMLHPSWTGSVSKGADLALLMLGAPLKGPYLRVLPQEDPATDRFDLEYMRFAGYGVKRGNTIAGKLQDVDLPFREKRLCNIIYQNANYNLPPGDAVCAGGFDAEACQGDSGGPLIVPGSDADGKGDMAVGVLSGGSPGCGEETNVPAAFTSLYHYIKDLMYYIPPGLQGPAGGAASSASLQGLSVAPATFPPPPPPAAPAVIKGTAKTDKETLLNIRLEKVQAGEWPNSPKWIYFTDMCTDWPFVTCTRYSRRPQQLSLGNKHITGPVPEAFSSLDALKRLFLFGNDMTGTLPASFSRLTNLESLSLFSNSVTGTLPRQWSTLTKLETLILTQNNLRGTVPRQWSTLNPSVVRLEDNALTGPTPFTWTGSVSI